jgi:hypothetical protein
MPRCIFCDRDVPHAISKERPERSLCLDCLVEMKRFELQNSHEVLQRLLPNRVIEAMKRLREIGPSQSLNQDQQAQMLRDLQTVKEMFPF